MSPRTATAAAATSRQHPRPTGWRKFRHDPLAVSGLVVVVLLLLQALAAPVLANGRPLLLYRDGHWSVPFLHFFFAPDSSEFLVEQCCNYLLLLLPLWWCCRRIIRSPRRRAAVLTVLALLLLLPFALTRNRMDKTDWRQIVSSLPEGNRAIFAPIPYGPFEQVAAPYQKSSRQHWLGTDQVGRDVLSRMIYGSRVSLAVGVMATGLAIAVGVLLGMWSGYEGGWVDIFMMRVVEIIICFPTFLLLLILMSLFMDRGFKQSILIVIGVLGLTGWTGLCRLARGEVLKLRNLPHIQSCATLGIPTWRILLFHLLPNITGPILVSFTFGIA
ncbi:MAG: ABC transporter permease, partial [Victivallales bacterium]|nr:ABC transporter permease [Victivallales bacterium]